MFSRIKGLSEKQVEALILIVPGPIGQGLTQKEAAKILGLNERDFRSRLTRFKIRFPDAWENFESMRNVSRRQEESLRNPISLSRGIDENRITERF